MPKKRSPVDASLEAKAKAMADAADPQLYCLLSVADCQALLRGEITEAVTEQARHALDWLVEQETVV
jgi:hypothetical protein